MATINLTKINVTPGMRSAQRWTWTGVLEPGTGAGGLPSGEPVAITVYSRAELQGYPDDYDTTAEKIGGWCFDLLDARGVALIRGAGLSVGIDLLWSYHGYAGVPPGKLICWTSTGNDPGLDGFAAGVAEIYYQPAEYVEEATATVAGGLRP